jgi:hypothetical protein
MTYRHAVGDSHSCRQRADRKFNFISANDGLVERRSCTGKATASISVWMYMIMMEEKARLLKFGLGGQ